MVTSHPGFGADLPPEDLQQQVLDLQALVAVKEDQIASRASELAQIRALMHQVTVYEGLVDISPLVMMVSDLVRDHDALEGRIDQAILYIKSVVHRDGARFGFAHDAPAPSLILDEVVRLLRGGTPIPDTIEEITGE